MSAEPQGHRLADSLALDHLHGWLWQNGPEAEWPPAADGMEVLAGVLERTGRGEVTWEDHPRRAEWAIEVATGNTLQGLVEWLGDDGG